MFETGPNHVVRKTVLVTLIMVLALLPPASFLEVAGHSVTAHDIYPALKDPYREHILKAINDPAPNHKPIYIVGDADFTEENGVIGGEGTKDDPYIIANWIIKANMTVTLDDLPFNTGIYIANTTKYFIIRNVTIYGGDFGIVLDNVSNFIIENSTFTNQTWIGIFGWGENGLITNNSFYDTDSGIEIAGDNITISNNRLYNLRVFAPYFTVGIELQACNNSKVVNNTIIGMDGGGSYNITPIMVTVWGGVTVRDILISGNTVENLSNGTRIIGIWIDLRNGTLQNLTIKNNHISNIQNASQTAAGISEVIWNPEAVRASMITIEGNTLSNISGSDSVEGEGIYLANTTSIIIKENEFSNIPLPMYLTNCSQVSIVGNNASEIQDTFIFTVNGDDYLIANNTAHGFSVNRGSWGFGITALTNNTVIEGNTIYDANALGKKFDAIWVGTYACNTTVHNIIVKNNVIKNLCNGSWTAGVVVWVPQYSSVSDVVVANNYMSNLTHQGVHVWGLFEGASVSDVAVKNNTIECSNNDYAIAAFKAVDVEILNNTVINSRGGIYFYNVTSGAISGNIVENTTEWPGIKVDADSSNIVVEDNNLRHIESDGVEIITSLNVSVYSNTLDGAKWAGISVLGSSDVLVKNNNVSGTNGSALLVAGYFVNNDSESVLTNTSRNVLVENNVFNGGYHPSDLVYIGDHSSNVTLTCNVMLDTGWSGVVIYEGSDVVVKENTIRNVGHSGMFIYNSSEVLVEGNSVENVSWACIDLTHNTNNSGITVVKNDLSVARSGVWMGFGNSRVEVHFNNIVNVSEWGVYNDPGNNVVNASLNWWGDVSGPSGAGLGSGVPVSSNVIYKPWLNAPYPGGKAISGNGSKASATLSGSEIIVVNATEEADTVVFANGSGSVEVSVIKYSANPVSSAPPKAFKFIDVHIDNSSAPSMIKVRIYYKASELNGLPETKITPYWWDGSKWVKCSNYLVNTTDWNGYSGYVEIIITGKTTPSLANLAGTPISLGSTPPARPVVGGTVEICSPSRNEGSITVIITAIAVLIILGAVAFRKE